MRTPLLVSVCCLLPIPLAADSFNELEQAVSQAKKPQSERKAEFHQWLNNYFDQFEAWRDEHTKQLDSQRHQLIDEWGEAQLSSETKEVNYLDNARTVVDYDQGTITVSYLLETNTSAADTLSRPDPVLLDGQAIDFEQAARSSTAITYSAQNEQQQKAFIIEQTQAQMNELDVLADRLIRSNTGAPESFILSRAHKKKLVLLEKAQQRIAATAELYQRKRKQLGIDDTLTANAIQPAIQSEKDTSVTAEPAPEQSADNQTDTPAHIARKIESNELNSSVEAASTDKQSMTDVKSAVTANTSADKANVVPSSANQTDEKATKTSITTSKVESEKLAPAVISKTKDKPVNNNTSAHNPIDTQLNGGASAKTADVSDQAGFKQVAAVKTPALTKTEASQPEKKIVTYKIKIPNNALKKRAVKFQPLALKESERWDIDPALIMAIMHSESAFRPKAKSHVPAFGLMQVVPTSAGHDVNKQMRKIDAPMKVADLYLPDVNVETGTAYLNILDNRYLRSIKNPQSRLYCTIAAYNTGAGNVARSFNPDRSTNIRKAAKIINQMPPDQVYDHLLKNLPYDETKGYLKKVTSRIKLYEANTL